MIPRQPWKFETLGGVVFASVLGPRLENDSDSRDSSDIRVRLATEKTYGILAIARYKSIAGLHFRIFPAPASVFFVVFLVLGSLVATGELVVFVFIKVWLYCRMLEEWRIADPRVLAAAGSEMLRRRAMGMRYWR